MNILFDLLHPSDVNLFKNIINTLEQKHHNTFIILRERGVLEKIARNELPNCTITLIGKHRQNFWRKIIFGLWRDFKVFFYLKQNRIDLVVCQGIACGLSCKLLDIKILNCEDDSEYKLTYYMGKFFSDIDVMPNFVPVSGLNIVKYKGYKELAYLHPVYFHADEKCLKQFDVKPNEYIFIREISNVSLNYQQRKADLKEIVNYITEKNLKILLSLENKKLINSYKDRCIILQEPIANLYSLIYFSKFAISTGDTMAREACLLGIPCIYTGDRQMAANVQFIKLGIMHQTININDIYFTIDQLLKNHNPNDEKKRMNEIIIKQFEDTNQVLFDQISKLLKDN